ncbi:hypothetical protein O3M35_007083 [Rhynocoris fuscipes]|uniref:Uncharacterized protein n=1 Tax=Rhynocoris fuscipes TaxID=488301 RepID=A0AAW1D837_9HEMI
MTRKRGTLVMEVGHFVPNGGSNIAWESMCLVGGSSLRGGGEQEKEAGARCSAWNSRQWWKIGVSRWPRFALELDSTENEK